MDNQFENEFYGFEPQKPITEKPTSAEPFTPTTPQPVDFQPQKPLMQNAAPQEDGFNPIRHTAVYTENRFEPTAPLSQAAPAPQVVSAQRLPQQPETEEPKPKANTALVIVIIVLSLLLAASLFAIFGIGIMQKQGQSGNRKQTVNIASQDSAQQLPEDNIENLFPVPSQEKPATVHNETDYSAKADKSYAGLTLAPVPADAATNKAYSAGYAYNAACDAVVSVRCYSDEPDDNANVSSEGSGIILSADGFVLTNSHVIGDSKTAYAIQVITADGTKYTAGVVGFDSRTDLAVLKLDGAKNLKPAVFGDSEKLTLGEDLVIIGNPGGIDFQNSMTKGIVSAINRDASRKSIVKYIQTDAAINPGNSGGPAVNNYGQVIGIASAKIVNEKYEGMGFCIPSAQAKTIVDSLIRNGYVDGRVKIGISGQEVTAATAQKYGVPRGIVVLSITKGGPCDIDGLEEGCIITALDGNPITSFADIYALLEQYEPGDKAQLSFYDPDADKEYEKEITLQADN